METPAKQPDSAVSQTRQSAFAQVPLHPFFLALIPTFSLFASNQGQARLEVLLVPCFLALALTGLVYLSLNLVLRNRERAAVLTSVLVLFFFFYGPFSAAILKVKFGEFVFLRNVHRIPLYLFLFLLLGFALVQLQKRWRPATRFLTVISFALLLMMFVNALWSWVSGAGRRNVLLAQNDAPESTAADPDALPDIYYIVLDGYASAESLQKFFGYDNTPFLDYLKAKGFSIPRKARCNYAMTVLSLGSSLGMEYISGSGMSQLPVNHVQQIVESNSYNYITISSMNPPLGNIEGRRFTSDALLFNEFNLQLLRTTVIDAIAMRFRLYTRAIRNNVLSTLSELKRLPQSRGRNFVFCHLVCPHPPYVFKADGTRPSQALSEANLSVYKSPWDNKPAYVEQLRFINSQLREVIDAILAKSAVPPIIILQSDHGPKLTVDEPTALAMHMQIFNAYYLPGFGKDAPYDTITPVNTFRLVFNRYLHCQFLLLEDKSYFSALETPFVFKEVPSISGQ